MYKDETFHFVPRNQIQPYRGVYQYIIQNTLSNEGTVMVYLVSLAIMSSVVKNHHGRMDFI